MKAAQALFYFNTAIWLIFGIASLVKLAESSSGQPVILWVVGVLMFGNAAAMLLAGLGLGARRRLYYYFALAVLGVNILLTFTDQFGILDFATLVIDVVLFGLLIATRGLYQK